MADHDLWRKNVPEGYDGRFGERFDDEISLPGVFKVGIVIAIACAVGMAITAGIVALYAARIEAARSAPSPIEEANLRRLPPEPRLQVSPEEELIEMRREMAERLDGYGWTDEGTGLVYIPVERAIDLVLERGLPAAPSSASDAPATDAGQSTAAEPAGDQGVTP